MENNKLIRRIGFPLLTFYGLGTILGAGIYVLVGKVATQAGLLTPLAFEGRIIAIVSTDDADNALEAMQSIEDGKDAAIIGEVESGNGLVILQTELGGERILDELEDDPLPRIC